MSPERSVTHVSERTLPARSVWGLSDKFLCREAVCTRMLLASCPPGLEVVDAQIDWRCGWQLPSLRGSCADVRPAVNSAIPRGLRKRPDSFQHCFDGQHGIFCSDFDSLRLRLRAVRPESLFTSCALVLHSWRGDGNSRHHSELEQRMAALVLAVMVAYLAGQLLDWTDAGGAKNV